MYSKKLNLFDSMILEMHAVFGKLLSSAYLRCMELCKTLEDRYQVHLLHFLIFIWAPLLPKSSIQEGRNIVNDTSDLSGILQIGVGHSKPSSPPLTTETPPKEGRCKYQTRAEGPWRVYDIEFILPVLVLLLYPRALERDQNFSFCLHWLQTEFWSF